VLKLVRDRPKFQALDTRPIPKGRRDNALPQIAGYFIGQGVRGEPLRIALHAINRDRLQASLEGDQVDKIAKSASSWPDRPYGWWTRCASLKIRDSTARADTSSRPLQLPVGRGPKALAGNRPDDWEAQYSSFASEG
jgi:Primase C terminal 1 (PriCT-1)